MPLLAASKAERDQPMSHFEERLEHDEYEHRIDQVKQEGTCVAGVPHGYCSCILLPHVLRDHRPHTERAQRRIAEALGAPHDDPADVIAELVGRLGLPGRLRDVGVTEDQLPLIATNSLSNMFVRQNPRPLRTADDILEILQRAY